MPVPEPPSPWLPTGLEGTASEATAGPFPFPLPATAAGAARTRQVTLVPAVSSPPLRPPAVPAKAVATLDRLTGSRGQLGLGAGAFWEAVEAMGGSRRTPKEAVDAREEATTVIRAMWSGERSVRTHGAHYSLAGVHPGPRRPPSCGCGWARTGPACRR
ncbi:LLM class flavin-dependent oxidoreductase [Streptomyces antimycoticus]|uniref:LLM class flavin-dependent oxidoreductase n=1 Tax=Streptomyces antimycoticus TaxID=68175 RepID=UPI0025706DB6|nr:LLM class flavin-dependent oxidoreductase [Streptomyces antimycoticus]WJE01615.1 LLM class flavin-dependent oxidoreductase [Streptomyces antimycoticus]